MGQCCGKCKLKTRSQRSRVANQKLRTDLNSPQSRDSRLAWMPNDSQGNHKQRNQLQVNSPSVQNDVGCGKSSRNAVQYDIKEVDHDSYSGAQQQKSCHSNMHTQHTHNQRWNGPLARTQSSWSLNNYLFIPDDDNKRNVERKQSDSSGEPSLQQDDQVCKTQMKSTAFAKLEPDKKAEMGASPIASVQLTSTSGRVAIDLPKHFKEFIEEDVGRKFCKQRNTWHKPRKQFAVVLLVSERDYNNIKAMKFNPSTSDIDNKRVSNPSSEQYENYIVARPQNTKMHAERVILKNKHAEFDNLWNAFMSKNNKPPKCVILYSWIFPCTKCTDLIIKSFSDPPYDNVSIIIAATQILKEEKHTMSWVQSQQKMEEDKKMTFAGFYHVS